MSILHVMDTEIDFVLFVFLPVSRIGLVAANSPMS